MVDVAGRPSDVRPSRRSTLRSPVCDEDPDETTHRRALGLAEGLAREMIGFVTVHSTGVSGRDASTFSECPFSRASSFFPALDVHCPLVFVFLAEEEARSSLFVKRACAEVGLFAKGASPIVKKSLACVQ